MFFVSFTQYSIQRPCLLSPTYVLYATHQTKLDFKITPRSWADDSDRNRIHAGQRPLTRCVAESRNLLKDAQQTWDTRRETRHWVRTHFQCAAVGKIHAVRFATLAEPSWVIANNARNFFPYRYFLSGVGRRIPAVTDQVLLFYGLYTRIPCHFQCMGPTSMDSKL